MFSEQIFCSLSYSLCNLLTNVWSSLVSAEGKGAAETEGRMAQTAMPIKKFSLLFPDGLLSSKLNIMMLAVGEPARLYHLNIKPCRLIFPACLHFQYHLDITDCGVEYHCSWRSSSSSSSSSMYIQVDLQATPQEKMFKVEALLLAPGLVGGSGGSGRRIP